MPFNYVQFSIARCAVLNASWKRARKKNTLTTNDVSDAVLKHTCKLALTKNLCLLTTRYYAYLAAGSLSISLTGRTTEQKRATKRAKPNAQDRVRKNGSDRPEEKKRRAIPKYLTECVRTVRQTSVRAQQPQMLDSLCALKFRANNSSPQHQRQTTSLALVSHSHVTQLQFIDYDVISWFYFDTVCL